MKTNGFPSWRGHSSNGLRATPLIVLSTLVVTFHQMIAAEPGAANPVQTATTSNAAIAANAVVPDAKVTLEARRLPLTKVLAAVSKQTKVTLTMAPDAFAKEPKTTMAVAQMSLREWMESLATLYDAHWEMAGADSFRLQSLGLSESEKGVRHMGTWYDYWGWPGEEVNRPAYLPPSATPDWKGLVDNNLDLDALTTTGVPFAEAPPELQRALRAAVGREVSLQLLWNTLLLNAAQGPLTISVTKPPGGSTVTERNRAGRVISTAQTPLPLSADILGSGNALIWRLDFRPFTGGRELVNDRSLFKRIDPNQPALAQASAPVQGGE